MQKFRIFNHVQYLILYRVQLTKIHVLLSVLVFTFTPMMRLRLIATTAEHTRIHRCRRRCHQHPIHIRRHRYQLFALMIVHVRMRMMLLLRCLSAAAIHNLVAFQHLFIEIDVDEPDLGRVRVASKLFRSLAVGVQVLARMNRHTNSSTTY